MEFRRSGERRRRVLMDEARLDADRSSAGLAEAGRADRIEGGDAPAPGYAGAARREQQPPITDLIPIRGWAVLVVSLLLATAWTGLQAIYGFTQLELTEVPQPLLKAFDLQRVDSLAGWYASLLLAAMTLTALGVFSIRRHRLDDYRGRYRVWLWVAALCCVASLETIVSLRELLAYLLAEATGATLERPQLWWWVPVTCVTLGCLIRTTIEVRRSRGAVFLLLLAAVGYGVVLFDQLFPLLPAGVARGMAISGTWLAAHNFAFLGALVYARFVFLEAQGLIKMRAARPRRQKKAKTSTEPKAPRKSRAKTKSGTNPKTTTTTITKTDIEPESESETPHAAPAVSNGKGRVGATIRAEAAPAAAKIVGPKNSNVPADHQTSADEESDDELSDPSLSRAERRRLKKEMRRKHRAAA